MAGPKRRWHSLRCLAVSLVCLALAGSWTGAQTPPATSLVADEIAIDAEAGTVTARGNVEVFHAGRVLRAQSITYSEPGNEIRATGPLVLTDEDGGLILADAAALTPDLVDGLITNARLLIAGELQLAAAEVRRTGARYTSLFNTVASSCEVCIGTPVPTWAIRAERVLRDEEELQVHFRNATLELFGLPVVWLPYLRVPDPTVTRASGFLVPEFRRSQIYGAGVRIPYYRVLGPSGDVTLTPFLTERGGTLLEGEVRRRFARGGFDIGGVVMLDNRLDDRRGRGALSATGSYLLPQDFRAEVDVNLTSDDQFLEQFDYSSVDRLTSTGRVVRSRNSDYFELGTVGFQSLRPDEPSEAIPFVVPELRYRRIWRDPALGGRFAVDLDALGLVREVGRDVARLGGGGDWRREVRTTQGVLAAFEAGAQVDHYRVRDDPGQPGEQTRLTPWTSAELRWPLARSTAQALHVIEPAARLIWSDALGDVTPPNEDSQLPEFDETNLFALDRFPGRDRVETGLRANLGIGYTRYGTGGWTLGATVGRVVRFDDTRQFEEGTGLRGHLSDWVGAVSVGYEGLSVLNRFRLDGDFAIRRNEFGLAYANERASVTAAYVFLAADASNVDLGPQPESNEITFDGRYRILPNWRVGANWRYDAATGSNIRAGGSLTYGNECSEFDLSVSRRFTASANVPPSTSIGFTVRLIGLSGSGTEDWPRRTCAG
jgi:LPS-assembly protein